MKTYTEQLRKEYLDWYESAKPELAPHQTKNLIADWFFSKHTIYLSELREKIRKLPIREGEFVSTALGEKFINETVLLSDVLTLLDNEK